jgi:lipoic acid synthetase
MLRIEARNAETPIERKPPWIKVRARMGPEYTQLRGLVSREGLHTVCQEAGCPNIYECWEDREATFLIGGDQCTRRCDFCQIDTGKPAEFDADEPRRVGESVAAMGLRYATITVLAHNVETVPRIFKRIRPAFRYERSLDVITQARTAGLVAKSNLILGLGEQRDEISQALRDLHTAGCELLTITQYLRPTPRHHPVERWVKPEEFLELREEALAIGFAGVMSGPLVRSSYRAGRLYRQAVDARTGAGYAAAH